MGGFVQTNMRRSYAALLVLLFAFLALGLWNLDGPPPWWDEGWTLSVARNVIERGEYVRLQNGVPVANGLEAAVPVTEAVALGMRLFGVGLAQGRMPILVSAMLALGLLWLVAARLFDARAAWGALAVTLLLSMHPQMHPLIMGRQVLAEMPLFFVLLASVVCLDLALRQHWAWSVPTTLFLALSFLMKSQTLPFLLVALLVAGAAAVLMRQWPMAVLIILCGVCSYLLYQPLAVLFAQWANQPFAVKPVEGLVEVMAVVTTSFNRLFALRMWFSSGLLMTIALGYVAWQTLRAWRSQSVASAIMLGRIFLLALVASWLGWFLALSVGVPRYMFPPIFIGSIFTGVLLRDLTSGFDWPMTLRRLTAPLRDRSQIRSAFPLWLVTLLVVFGFVITFQTLVRYYLTYTDHSVVQVAQFFNTETPANTRIETYESELHFFLNRPYTFPEDQWHVELNKRSLLGQKIEIGYDPLAHDPDYLVVGKFADGNDLYKPAIDAGQFRLLRTVGDYQVYERVR